MYTKILKNLALVGLAALSQTLVNAQEDRQIRSCNVDKTIALTFDDGPFEYTGELVDYLIQKHPDVRVTFFQVARFHYPFATETVEFQDAMKRAHDHGFQIATHTYGHKISENEVEFKKSLDDMDAFIEKTTGDKPRYFRPPKGNCEAECQKRLNDWGYNIINWDTDTNDWNYVKSGSFEQRVVDSIDYLKQEFAKEKSNYLVLMHDTQNYTVREIAPWILEKSGMKEKGYKFVTVGECLGDKEGIYRSHKIYNDIVEKNNTTDVNNNSTTNNNGTIIPQEGEQSHLTNGASQLSSTFAILQIVVLGLLSLYYYHL